MRKIKITGLPQAKQGGDISSKDRNNAMFFPWPVLNGTALDKPDVQVNKTLQPVERKDANLEAEKGETVVTDMNGDGITEFYTIGGERHSAGGTPLDLPEKSFIFSRDNKMKIKDQNILKDFGTSGSKTPADISKKYDINEFRRILADPDTDKLQKKTAEQMIANYNLKLSKLSLAQESIKGFPNGIPSIAMPYLMATQTDPSELLGTQGQQEQPQGNMSKYGGEPCMDCGGEPKFEKAGEVSADPGVDPWKSKNEKITPTKRNSDAPYTKEQYNALFKKMGINTDTLTPAQAQEALYKKADPYQKAYMWGAYGDTKQGASGSKFEQYAPLKDSKGNVIENQAQYKTRMSSKYTPEQLNQELDPLVTKFADNKHGARVAMLLQNQPEPVKPEEVVPIPPGVTPPPVADAAIPPVQHLQGVPAKENDQYWLQDIVKTAGATNDFLRVKKYEPWQATPGVDYVDPTFYDPNREIAAQQEQMNIGTQGAQIFTGPQAFNARFAQMQGQGAKGIADTMSRVNNLNVGVANQTEAQNTDIYNQHSQNLAGLATQFFDKQTIVNQQFDNSKNMARQNMRQSYIDAITNKNETGSLNTMFPQYHINPLEGGRVRYTGKEAPFDTTAQDQDAAMKQARRYMTENPGMKWDEAIKLVIGDSSGGGRKHRPTDFEQYQQMLNA